MCWCARNHGSARTLRQKWARDGLRLVRWSRDIVSADDHQVGALMQTISFSTSLRCATLRMALLTHRSCPGIAYEFKRRSARRLVLTSVEGDPPNAVVRDAGW